MAKSNFVQNSFVSGELAEEVKSRTDLDQYFKGMEVATNVVTTPQGGVKRRMGSQFVDRGVADTTPFIIPNNASYFGAITDDSISADERLDIITDNTSTYSSNNLQNSELVLLTIDLQLSSDIAYIDFKNIKLSGNDGSGKTDNNFWLYSSDNGTDYTLERRLPTLTDYNKTIRVTPSNPPVSGAGLYSKRYWQIRRTMAGASGNLPDLDETTFSFTHMQFHNNSLIEGSNGYKLHSFNIDKNNSFLLFFGEDNLRIFKVTKTETVFHQDINHGLGVNYPNRVAVNQNVCLLFNKNVAPRRLVYNYDGDGLFFYDTPTFTNVPKFDFDDKQSPAIVDAIVRVDFPDDFVAGDRYQLEVDGVLSKEITYHGDTGAGAGGGVPAGGHGAVATASAMQKNLQEMPVFGDTGITVARTGTDQYTVTMTGDSANDYPIMGGFPTHGSTATITFDTYTQGATRKEDVWSATRGYPNLGVFAQGRLWIGGTRDKPQVLLASQAGNFFNFNVDKGLDDEGFLFTMNGAKSAIVDVTGGRGVTVFTEGAEFAITGNTPSTLDAEQQTQHGSFSENVPTLALDGATLFVDRNGKSIRQFMFDHTEASFRSVDMSVLSSHLINAPLDMDAITGTTANDANYVFVINGDGTGVMLNTLREQDITGFTKFNMKRTALAANEIYNFNSAFAGGEDKYEQVVAVNNVFHVLINDDGDNNNYVLCRLDDSFKMDMSVKFQPTASADSNGYYHPASLVGGRHLTNQVQPMSITAGNSVLPPRYASQYSVAIPLSNAERQLNEVIEVGRNFVPEVKPMPLATVTRSGDNTQMALKRINKMNMRVIKSAGVNIDGIPVAVREFGGADNSPLNTSLEVSTGIIEDNNGGNGWDREVAPKITVPDPTPFHLLAIDYEISS